LSVRGEAISKRIPSSYILMNEADAAEQKFSDGQEIQFDIEGQLFKLPVKLSKTSPKGVAGLPYGLEGVPFVELPAWLIYKK
jgi:NADH-quinone oxidoreductase subunit G